MAMTNACRHSYVWKFAVIAWGMMATVIVGTGSTGAQRAGEEIKRFELHIENGRLADGPKTIRVRRGDPVEITWHVDRPTAVHLHGYDIEISANSERPQTMSFEARATGRFAIETHASIGAGGGRHTVLMYLEVYPR